MCNITLRQYLCFQMLTSKSCLNLPTPQFFFASIAASEESGYRSVLWDDFGMKIFLSQTHRILQGEAERMMCN